MNHRSGKGYLPAHRQQGVALVISLVLLVTMTILGVATLSGTRLNEKRTANAQQKSIAFEVAESGIAAVWDIPYLTSVVTSDGADSGDDPRAVMSAEADTGLDSDFNQAVDGNGVIIDGTLSVQYCGETVPMGSSQSADESRMQMVYMLIDINSVARVPNTSTQADHVQRGAITSVKTNRTGNCPAP